MTSPRELRCIYGSWYRFHLRNRVVIFIAILGTLAANLTVVSVFGVVPATGLSIALIFAYRAGLMSVRKIL